MSDPTDRLYGLPGAERCWSDPATVWESDIEPCLDADNLGPWTIVERAVLDPLHQVRSADLIVNDLHEWFCGEYGAEDCPLEGIENDPEVLAAAENLRRVFASKVTWRWAGELVAEHTLELVDGEPFLDGEPLYQSRDGL